MEIKGFTEDQNNIETPNGVNESEKPLKSNQINSSRVDINVLKSKIQESENKEFKKNLYILHFSIHSLKHHDNLELL